MGTRGMLPKFRPAILGAQRPPTRPIIRAVKPIAPLPPPSPPRRMPSVLDSGLDYATPSTPPMGADELSDLFEASTQSLDEPPTTRRASHPVLDAEIPDTFEDETRVRGEEQTRVHHEDETRLRQDDGDEYDCETQRHEPRRDALASTRRQREAVTPPVDTERSFADDRFSAPASFQHTTADEQPPHMTRGDRATDVPRTYLSPPPAFDPLEDSGARARPFDDAPAPSNDHRASFDSIKLTRPLLAPEPIASTTVPDRTSGASVALIPQDVRPHVAGLMPTQLSAPMPAELAAHLAPPQAAPQYTTFPMPQVILSGSGGSHVGSFEPAQIHYHRPPQPTAPRLATTRSDRSVAAKVGRFAWFVFGAAFGLFFAFFATGFVSPRIVTKNEAAATTAQVPTAQPVAPPATAAPPATMAAAPVQAPVPVQNVASLPTAAPVQPVAVAPAQYAAPVAVAPAAPAAAPAVLSTPAVAAAPKPRTHTHRAPPPPKPAAAEADDDEDGLGPAPRARSKGKPADVADLLNAGIAP